jgi:transaldolase
MKQNPLLNVQEFGQSIWQDYIQRGIILSGELKRLIDEDGIRGVTSNPSMTVTFAPWRWKARAWRKFTGI